MIEPTRFLHSLNKCLLLGDPLDVDFDVSEREPLKVHLCSDHIRGINKGLKRKE